MVYRLKKQTLSSIGKLRVCWHGFLYGIACGFDFSCISVKYRHLPVGGKIIDYTYLNRSVSWFLLFFRPVVDI